MLLTIDDVLTSEEIAVAQDLISKGSFQDGKLTAGSEAERVKNNQELAGDDILTPLNNLVMGKLVQNQTYLNACFPKQIMAPIYARYKKGMAYGEHIDDPIMGTPPHRLRTDISLTVFLNAPDYYDGGELVVKTQYGEHTVKGDAGSVVLYPSGSTHRVNEVTSGERLVAVTWLESTIREPERRELLYNLSQAREALLESDPESDTTQRVSNTYINLVRMWAEL